MSVIEMFQKLRSRSLLWLLWVNSARKGGAAFSVSVDYAIWGGDFQGVGVSRSDGDAGRQKRVVSVPIVKALSPHREV